MSGAVRPEATHEPRARRFPVALHGDCGDADDFSDFVLGETAEEPELDDTSRARIERFEFRQRRVERQEILVLCDWIPLVDRAQTDLLVDAASLLRDASPRMVDQNPSHRLRSDREEVSPGLVGDRLGAEQADAELVHQRVGLECVLPAFVMQESRRELMQLRMNHVEQAVARALVALAPFGQPHSDLLGK